jgi:hypothetical protein
VGCVMGDGAIIARGEDPAGSNVVLARPESVTTFEAVEVLIVGRMGLVLSA